MSVQRGQRKQKRATTLAKLYDIAASDQVCIEDFSLPRARSMSILGSDGLCTVGIDMNQITGETEEAEVLAHELGHCETGAFYNRYSSFDVIQKHEKRADAWAINHLVPRERLELMLDHGVTEAAELAEFFSVSESFMRKALRFYYFE